METTLAVSASSTRARARAPSRRRHGWSAPGPRAGKGPTAGQGGDQPGMRPSREVRNPPQLLPIDAAACATACRCGRRAARAQAAGSDAEADRERVRRRQALGHVDGVRDEHPLSEPQDPLAVEPDFGEGREAVEGEDAQRALSPGAMGAASKRVANHQSSALEVRPCWRTTSAPPRRAQGAGDGAGHRGGHRRNGALREPGGIEDGAGRRGLCAVHPASSAMRRRPLTARTRAIALPPSPTSAPRQRRARRALASTPR